MERLFEICDEMAAPEGPYVKIREIMERYHGEGVGKLSYLEGYNKLRKQLDRNRYAIEYQKSDLRSGFRYKKGFEDFFRKKEEKKILESKDGDERRLFVTGGLQMLFEGETASEHLIELECVMQLHNLCLVKVLAKYLGQRVVAFKYMQGYENLMDIKMHPHILKEYNSRWFLFGFVVKEDGRKDIVNFSLDRIEYCKPTDIKPLLDEKFEGVSKDFYQEYFKDIVGVTKPENSVVQTIDIRTTDFKIHHLLRTKPLHSSQGEKMPYDNERKEGLFTIRVIPNIELQTKLLSYGPGVYVTGDGQFQKQLREAVANMDYLYSSVMETERIVLRPWRESDSEALFKYASDSDVGPGAGWAPHQSMEESLEIIRTHFNNDHTWAIEFKETGEAIGAMGYMLSSESNISIGENDVEVGYWVAKPYWNQGICTEALRLLIGYCNNRKHFQGIWGDFFVDNPASGRVMEKCGFHETGDMSYCSHLYGGGERPVKIMKL